MPIFKVSVFVQWLSVHWFMSQLLPSSCWFVPVLALFLFILCISKCFFVTAPLLLEHFPAVFLFIVPFLSQFVYHKLAFTWPCICVLPSVVVSQALLHV